jgi:uncharacterized protein (DUF1778 family)
MAIVQARLSEEEDAYLREYAKAKGTSVSDLVRESVFRAIEDDLDLLAYERAMAEHVENPQTVSFAEMVRLINA